MSGNKEEKKMTNQTSTGKSSLRIDQVINWRKGKYVLFLLLAAFTSSIYFMSSAPAEDRAETTLVKVFVGFRHGLRSPLYTYPNDPYKKDNEKYWPEGPEELTKLGKQESFELGLKLRARYNDFIGDLYNSRQFKAYSTLVERTMMTAQIVLAAFFPPKSHQLWSENLPWQPVPVYPETISNLSSGINCPRFSKESTGQLKKVENFFKLDGSRKEEIMSNLGGPKLPAYALLLKMWDTAFFQERANYPLPDWMIRPKELLPFVVRGTLLYLTGNTILQQLVAGPYAKGVFDYFNSGSTKMEFHSWHDLNTIPLLQVLEVEIDFFPEPNSAAMIELHKRNGQLFYEVYYYDSPRSHGARQLKMSCGLSCPLDHLSKIAKIWEVDNYHQLCQNGSDPNVIHVLKPPGQ